MFRRQPRRGDGRGKCARVQQHRIRPDQASYDPQRGLLLNVLYTLYNDGRPGKAGVAIVRVDLRDKGSVKIER